MQTPTESTHAELIATNALESIKELEMRLQKMSDKELRAELINRNISGKQSAVKKEKIGAIIFHAKYENAGKAVTIRISP
jgi:hypothetical protein